MHTNPRFRVMTHKHTRFMTNIRAFAIQEFRTLFISNTQRGREGEGESESERESSKGHHEVYPERKRMLFCLWEGTSSRGWETSLFLKSCFSANSLSERKTMTERETPNAISPMSYSVTSVSSTGEKRQKETQRRHFLGGGLNERQLWTLASREKTTPHSHLTHQINWCAAFGWESQGIWFNWIRFRFHQTILLALLFLRWAGPT